MRHFYKFVFENLIWIYLCVLLCFAYTTMMDAIPDHVFLEEGQALSLSEKLPVVLSEVADEKAVMAETGESTFALLQERKAADGCETLKEGLHRVTCYLFGLLPVKQVEVSVVPQKNIYAGGQVVGIYGATYGVLVLGSSPVEKPDGGFLEPAEHILKAGDYITAVNDRKISEKEELIDEIQNSGGKPLVLTLFRGSEKISVSVTPVMAKSGGYMLGLWVKDDMAGIGTLTYFEQNQDFGALGHGIGDGQTGDLLRLSEGRLYRAQILGIKKGERGAPGELEGMVYYGSKNRIGEVNSNSDIGIYGTLTEEYFDELCGEDSLYPVGYRQEVSAGPAVLLSNVSGEPALYHIVIDSLDYTPADSNKGIHFHVDDENLLALTGGIVQGLSGSPIIQNGKIVGAVTHVLVSDPARGYGIFIENML